ncbi:MAG: c-type cytochrome [Kistimonas sp.]|nr:c-type cytochrome [Kistimonas sp.]
MRNSKWQALLLSASLLLVCTAFQHVAAAQTVSDEERGEIETRIAPVGRVCLEGEPCATAPPPVVARGPRSGETIYGKHCIACHKAGLLGAPKKGDAAAWQQREKDRGGFAQLLAHALSGFNNMPVKGTCANCTDDEISTAIEYMSGLSP